MGVEGLCRTDEILLYSIGFLSERFEGDRRYAEKDLVWALDTTVLSLRQYLSKLRKESLVKKNDLWGIGHEMTEKGLSQYKKWKPMVESLELVPEKHGVSRRCGLKSMSDLIRDPFVILRITSAVCRNKKIDIPELLQISRALKPGSRERLMLNEMLSGGGDRSAVENVLDDLLFPGMKPEIVAKAVDEMEGVDSLLILAELKRKRGEVSESKAILNGLLSRREGLNTDQWMVAILTWIHIVRIEDGPDKALDLIDKTMAKISKPIHIGLLKKTKADINSDMKDYDGSLVLYKTALGIFHAQKTKMLELTAMNNMGVTYFRQDRFEIAMKTWQKVRNLSSEHDYIMMKAIVGLNLADSYAKIGKIKRAHEILRESARVMEDVGDLESLSGVEFNRALVYVEEGKKEKALEHFELCEKFPFTSELNSIERRDVLRDRFRQKGWVLPI